MSMFNVCNSINLILFCGFFPALMVKKPAPGDAFKKSG